jgi:hypothetical protein
MSTSGLRGATVFVGTGGGATAGLGVAGRTEIANELPHFLQRTVMPTHSRGTSPLTPQVGQEVEINMTLPSGRWRVSKPEGSPSACWQRFASY